MKCVFYFSSLFPGLVSLRDMTTGLHSQNSRPFFALNEIEGIGGSVSYTTTGVASSPFATNFKMVRRPTNAETRAMHEISASASQAAQRSVECLMEVCG